jgi:multidrug efflux pump
MVFEILRITVKAPILQIAPKTDRLPVQFVIGTTESCERMNEASQALMDKALRSGTFAYMDTDLKIDKPQTTIEIDRDKAAQLGL